MTINFQGQVMDSNGTHQSNKLKTLTAGKQLSKEPETRKEIPGGWRWKVKPKNRSDVP